MRYRAGDASEEMGSGVAMNAILNKLNVTGSKRLATLALAAAGACCMLGAAPAEAGDRYGRDRYRDRDERVSVGIEVGSSRHHHDDDYCEPGYAFRETKVWVEPVYRTVCDRVWVE